MSRKSTVFVVDDDDTFRASLRWLLESMGLEVQEHASADEFLAAYDGSQAGCLLLDVRMPHLSGLQLQDVLAARGVPLPVIVVTGHADVPMAVRAMKAGALDVLEKPFNDQALLERVEEALALDAKRRSEAAARGHVDRRLRLLTPREREVLDGIVSGRSNKHIAADLGISVKTVEAHRAHVMDKMQVQSVAQLTMAYLAHGAEHAATREKPLAISAIV